MCLGHFAAGRRCGSSRLENFSPSYVSGSVSECGLRQPIRSCFIHLTAL